MSLSYAGERFPRSWFRGWGWLRMCHASSAHREYEQQLLVSLIRSSNVQLFLPTAVNCLSLLYVSRRRIQWISTVESEVEINSARCGVQVNKNTGWKNLHQQKACQTNIQLAFCIFFFMVTWASSSDEIAAHTNDPPHTINPIHTNTTKPPISCCQWQPSKLTE